MAENLSPAQIAPIAIFAYRRPDHLRNTLQSLVRCEGFVGSKLFVFCDGPKSDAERADVEATRAVARELLGEAAEYHFSEKNRGLSTSVIAGVNTVLDRFDRVIVIEDDLELASDFLVYMNDALDRYAGDERVYQVSGYMFNAREIGKAGTAVFLPFTSSWGWATWRRAWTAFEADAPGWPHLLSDAGLRYRFNIDGTYDFSSMLVRQMLGFRDSWAVRWCWSVFRRNGLVLYPPASLVKNTGFDGSGTHGRGVLRHFSDGKADSARIGISMPSQIAIDQASYGHVKRALWQQNGRWLGRLTDSVRWWRTCRLAARHLESGSKA
ncbi:MAG: hypothetical protein RI928_2197 [Pseudomonadota bacterium]|jgi:hypothetical protein